MSKLINRRHRVGMAVAGWVAGATLLVIASLFFLGGTTFAGIEDVGYRDFSWIAPTTGPGVTAPTAEKNQSKLWYNDGIWWGAMFNPVGGGGTNPNGAYDVYRLDPASNTWIDTGTIVDGRNPAHPDVRWDGTHLYVASSVQQPGTSSDNVLLFRFSYDSATKTYTLDPGFIGGHVIASGIALQGVVIDKASDGTLWATYTQNSTIFVTHSTTDDLTWVAPFTPAVSGTTLTTDDLASLIAVQDKVAIMWSNQVDGHFYWATHNNSDPDTTWQAAVLYNNADNHINMKSVQADASGRVYAVIKTNNDTGPNPDPNAPLIVVLVIDSNGTATPYTYGIVNDDMTRPMLLLDQENRQLYVFAVTRYAGGTINDGTAITGIYYKQTSMDNIQFAPGLGTEFIKTQTDQHITDPTSTKQSVNSTTGIVVLAADTDTIAAQGTHWYLHNTLSISPAVTVTPTATGTPTTCNITFTDVPPNAPFYSFITCLACRGIISGYSDHTFRPGANVTRGQISKIVANSAGFNEPVSGQHFQDVPPTSPFYLYIERMSRRNIISGYNCGGVGEPCVPPANLPYFRPNANATRGQISKIVVNSAVAALGWTLLNPPTPTFQDVGTTTPFYQYIETAYSHAVLSGYNCGGPGEPCVPPGNKPYFRPNTNATRGQTSKIVANTFFPNCRPALPGQPIIKP